MKGLYGLLNFCQSLMSLEFMMTNTDNQTGQLSVVTNNVVNLYAEPNSSSEMISQAVMGQPVWVENAQDEWSYVRMWDGYRGWARSKWISSRERSVYANEHAVAHIIQFFADVFATSDKSSDIITKVVITTELELMRHDDDWVQVVLPNGRIGHIKHSDVRLLDKVASPIIIPPAGDKLVATASRFIGTPYLWGGTTPFGIDCSGFIQLVYHIHGITLPRDSRMQADYHLAVPLDSKLLKAGDLVFFAGGDDKDRITHVGMAIGDGRFIHASGGDAGVIISNLDESRYQDIYWGVRRIKCEN
jgi:cell wall-associated NlpC family hydrolase